MIGLLFIVTQRAGGGYTARAVGPTLGAEAESDEKLERILRGLVEAHYDRPENRPGVLHLHYVRDEAIPLDDGSTGLAESFPLRGTVTAYVDPFEPACESEEWDANS